jgi:hypothetical protein
MIESPDHTEADKAAPWPMILGTLLRWAFGFTLSLLAIWAITAVGTENLYPKVWSKQLHRNVAAPGWSFHNRNEAWAETKFGELGLRGTYTVAAPSVPKIFLWGDSFVEAAQVDDREKMHRQLNELLANDPEREVQVIPLGHRFQSFADYVLQMPLHEKEISPCALHVIHLQSLDDVFPDRNEDARISLFLSKPDFHFVKYDNEFREVESPVQESALKSLSYRLGLHFFLRTKKRIFQIARLEGLRFLPGEQSLAAKDAPPANNDWNHYLAPEWANGEAPSEAWEFLIDSLRSATTLPILIVYAPVTPVLYEGQTVKINPEEDLVRVFGDICRERGLGFVNMEKSFLEYHGKTGKFPKGFQTSRPWEGHYNTNGHRLVAESIHRWIEAHHDAVYTD